MNNIVENQVKKNTIKNIRIACALIGTVLVIAAVILYISFFNALFADDYTTFPSDYLIGAIACFIIGTMICLIPNQMAMVKWNLKSSMTAYTETLDKMGMKINQSRIMTQQIGISNIRLCVECGRNIPFDANLCPYCGHDYIMHKEPKPIEKLHTTVKPNFDKCPNCGDHLDPNTIYCPECGEDLTKYT